MANSIFKKWKRFAGCALFAVCSLHAASGPKIVAKVPFDFVVRNQKMAAGEYTISIDSLRTVILVRGEADNSAVFTLTTAAESGKINVDPKLVFRRYGDRFFLSQVWLAGTGSGREVLPSSMERELARNTGKPQIVAVTAKAAALAKAVR